MAKYEGMFHIITNPDDSFRELIKPHVVDTFPPKQQWKDKILFEDVGNVMKPKTKKAEDHIEEVIKWFKDHGYTGRVHKPGNRKTTTLKYAILTDYTQFELLKS